MLFDLPVPGGLDGLCSAVGLPPTFRPVGLLPLIRVLYANPTTAADTGRLLNAIESRLQNGAASSPSTSDTVPLPLSPDIWAGTIFKGAVTADRLLAAILRDRRASLLYYGLMSVDDATLEYFEAHPALLAAVYDRGAGPFATFARSVHVRHDTIVLPGDTSLVPAWEDIVGERASTPDRFVLALMTGDEGRRAYLLDAVAHLDAARQAFALAASRSDRRQELLRSLYGAIRGFEPASWDLNAWPFLRRPADAAEILMRVAVSKDGHMAPPASQRFWRAALDGNTDGCGRAGTPDDIDEVDPSWLVSRVLSEPRPETRRAMLNAILFAQRTFGAVAGPQANAACQAVARFPRFAGLVVTLEHLGFSQPADYLRALDFAQGLSAEVDPRTPILSLAQMQSTLAVLERLVAASPAQRNAVLELVRSLCNLPVPAVAVRRPQRQATQATAPLFPGRFGEWAKNVLVPRLCRAGDSPDVCLQELAAGVRDTDRHVPVIEWEGQRYRVDTASASNVRVARIRERQRSTTIESAIAVVDIGLAVRDQPFSEPRAAEQAKLLQQLAADVDPTAQFFAGGTLGAARSTLERAARTLAAARRKPPTAAADILEAADVLLADALVSFAYALAIGDPGSSYLLADDPARRHEFLAAGALAGDYQSAWQLAEERWTPKTGWRVHGSVLGLPLACAPSWMRRLSLAPIAVRPTLSETTAHGFHESVAALNAADLTDAGLAGITAAIRRGRTTLAALGRDPDTLAARISELGASEWRARAAEWLARRDPVSVPKLFSLAELLWLGNPEVPRAQIDAWGVPATPLDGSLSLRMPNGEAWENIAGRNPAAMSSYVADLHLRVAMWLDEAKLPAALMPAIVTFATWDLITTAQPVDPDDYLAVVRAAQSVPSEHLSDYVSALATDGTLVPVAKSSF